MDLNDYFDPVSLDKPIHHILDNPNAFCRNIAIHTPSYPVKDLNHFQVAILGVPEERETTNKGCGQAPDKIRNKLYQLMRTTSKSRVIDLGNLKTGKSAEDTFFGLRDVMHALMDNSMICIVLGGAQQLTYPLCLVFEEQKKRYTLTTIDSHFDFEVKPSSNLLTSENYLNKILHGRNHLFAYNNLGHQQYFAEPDQSVYLEDNFHHCLRVGSIRSSLKETEPILRDTNILSTDIRAVRYSDSPGYINPSPNGLYGEEICQISRYAGMSNNLKILGIFEVNPSFDPQDISSHLAAQMIWYFIEGIGQRTEEFPLPEDAGFKKFIIKSNQVDPEIVFYKSLITERWWMEIPVIKGKSREHIIIACSDEDYKIASAQNIPERWWKFFRKLN